MPGLSEARLVLVVTEIRFEAGQGQPRESHRVGTGYFIAPTLVLTASHVVPTAAHKISLRVEAGEPRWRYDGRVIWRDDELDAALVQVNAAVPSVEPVEWIETLADANVSWTSTGYPDAAVTTHGGGSDERKSAGLDGTLYVHGGGGQGQKELDLGVNSAAIPTSWAGLSGAPVFIGARLSGIIKSVPTDFRGNRLSGVPAHALLQNPGFRLALAPAWLNPPSTKTWVLVLPSERAADLELTGIVQGSIERHDDMLTKAVGQSLTNRVIEVTLADALASPERWLQFVEVLCKAPILVADVTGFEPAVMLALGIRAVVRRGLTIATTADRLDETKLSRLPFNIQEAKLISHGDKEPGISDEHPRFSLNILAKTMAEGMGDLRSNPRYLDLPAYDAVRCPAPELPSDQQKARETVLVLCSFHKDYSSRWRLLANALVKRYPAKRIVRMVDIASPRLVGQALYEHIRWAKTCVVDWTHWRPNVFFELGVRLACSNVEPVCLLDESNASEPLSQKTALITLFRPTRYTAGNLARSLADALELHEKLKLGAVLPRPAMQLPHNATYGVSLSAFDYAQDRVAVSPHEMLRAYAEMNLGKDPQKVGETPVLFATNPAFSQQLWRSVREQWIAAWLYVRHRFPESELKRNVQLQTELKRIGDSLLQWVREDPADPAVRALRDEVFAMVREWGIAAAGDLLSQIRDLKTRAKNERDFRRYDAAGRLLKEALHAACSELESLDRAKQADRRKTIASELADCEGLLGGVERRWALEAQFGPEVRRMHLQASVDAYDRGDSYEGDQEFGLESTYNALNRLLSRLLLDPSLLAPGRLATGLRGEPFSVPAALEDVARKIEGLGRDDYWSQADLALIGILSNRQDAVAAYAAFDARRPPDFAYKSVLDSLTPLIDAGLPMANELRRAQDHLRARVESLHADVTGTN